MVRRKAVIRSAIEHIKLNGESTVGNSASWRQIKIVSLESKILIVFYFVVLIILVYV